MRRLELRFISRKSSFVMIMESGQQDIDHFVSEFLSMFPSLSSKENDTKDCKVTIEAFQRSSQKLRSNIAIYLDKHKKANPQVHKLRQFVEELTENEYFFFAPNKDFSSKDILKITSRLTALNQCRNFDVVTREYQDLFGHMMANYEIVVFDNSKRSRPIGEPARDKRICRFCGKSQPEVQFRNKAHAISEGLGNKSIILNEECDACNVKFGETIERDIINYLGLCRTFFGVRVKDGIPAIVGKNFKLRYVANQQLEISYIPNEDSTANTFEFETLDTVVLQNIYKALCKFALSVIENEHLGSFKDTVKWINGEISCDRLPKVATLIKHNLLDFTSSPAIAIYRRKNNNRDFPHMIGEFRFTNLLFVFIVPLSAEDDRFFDTDSAFSDLWKLFRYYEQAGNGKWEFNDFSDTNKIRVGFKIVPGQKESVLRNL